MAHVYYTFLPRSYLSVSRKGTCNTPSLIIRRKRTVERKKANVTDIFSACCRSSSQLPARLSEAQSRTVDNMSDAIIWQTRQIGERYKLTLSIIVRWHFRNGVWVYVLLLYTFYFPFCVLEKYPLNSRLRDEQWNLGFVVKAVTKINLYICKIVQEMKKELRKVLHLQGVTFVRGSVFRSYLGFLHIDFKGFIANRYFFDGLKQKSLL